MCFKGLRLLILLATVLGTAGGCAGVPPAAQNDFSKVVQVSATEPVATPEPELDEESGFGWSDLDPASIAKRVKDAAGYGPNEEVAQAALDKGNQLLQQKDYSAAASQFKTAVKRWPDSLLEEDAMFLQGESYFFADLYPKAQDSYENLLSKYNNSRHLDTIGKRLFAIGQYWERLHEANPHWPVTPNLTNNELPTFDTFGNALKAYEMIRLNDPTGPVADDSVMATANAYFRKGRYEDAAFHYDILRKEYPKSEHQADAHLLGMKSKLEVYQGARYDRTPLDEADKIAEQALSQFRGELGEESSRVAAERDRIVEQKAARDWAMGQFYEKKKQFRAARYYYELLIEEFPLTQHAQQARTRLDQIRNEPDKPPNRFRWLTDVFEREENPEEQPVPPPASSPWLADILRTFQHPSED